MISPQNLYLTVDFRSAYADLSPKQLDDFTSAVFQELRSLDSVEQVQRVVDPNPPVGSMGGATLMGILMTEVSLENIRKLLGYVGQKFGSKPVDIEIDVSTPTQNRKIKLAGVRPEDLDKVVAVAERLAAGQNTEHG